MGQEGKNEQDRRSSNLIGTGPERQLQSAREATRRVGEYEVALQEEIMGILDTNANKNFVQRIISPENSPKLYDGPDGELGKASTHSMAWGTADGQAFVYPTVVASEGGGLVRLEPEEAWAYARDNDERIAFGQDHAAASRFAKHYKKIWESE